MTPPPDRPLALGELFAETIRIYGERVWAAFGLGAFTAAALVVGYATGHPVPFVVVLSLAFTAAFAAAARLVAGDEFREAWGQVALRVPTLLVLTVVVSVPFALGRIDPIILVFAVAWLAGTGFSIPVAVVERDESVSTWFSRLGFALQRSLTLARAEFLHAMGIIAALVVVYYLLGVILAGALAGFADNSAAVATLLVQIVLAPFFFLGLAVLYFEQRARLAVRPVGR